MWRPFRSCVDSNSFRQVIGVTQEAQEDVESGNILSKAPQTGLSGIRLCCWEIEILASSRGVFSLLPHALYQQCVAYFERNVASHVLKYQMEQTLDELKTIFSLDTRDDAFGKVKQVEQKLRDEHLSEAANLPGNGMSVVTTYFEFPSKHWKMIRTNNMIEWLNWQIRRRTRVVDCFRNRQSALMLVCARIIFVTGNCWDQRKYLDMSHLRDDNQKQA